MDTIKNEEDLIMSIRNYIMELRTEDDYVFSLDIANRLESIVCARENYIAELAAKKAEYDKWKYYYNGEY
jgi:hypothetical protein